MVLSSSFSSLVKLPCRTEVDRHDWRSLRRQFKACSDDEQDSSGRTWSNGRPSVPVRGSTSWHH